MKKTEEQWLRAQVLTVYRTNVKAVFLDTQVLHPDTGEEFWYFTFDHNDPEILPSTERMPEGGNIVEVQNFGFNPGGVRAYKVRYLKPVIAR